MKTSSLQRASKGSLSTDTSKAKRRLKTRLVVGATLAEKEEKTIAADHDDVHVDTFESPTKKQSEALEEADEDMMMMDDDSENDNAGTDSNELAPAPHQQSQSRQQQTHFATSHTLWQQPQSTYSHDSVPFGGGLHQIQTATATFAYPQQPPVSAMNVYASSAHHSSSVPASFSSNSFPVPFVHSAPNSPNSDHQKNTTGHTRSPPPPLIVMDGANVAYTYTQVMLNSSPLPQPQSNFQNQRKRNPADVTGIVIAADYFANAGCTVVVVLPQSWVRVKPQPGDSNRDNAMMVTDQLEALQKLTQAHSNLQAHNPNRGHVSICYTPPSDDDDAYAIAMARSADDKYHQFLLHQHEHEEEQDGMMQLQDETEDDQPKIWGGGYVLSCDLFRDAIQRDRGSSSTGLADWLSGKNRMKNLQQHGQDTGGGRISYTFYHDGERLQFVPNPRHFLVAELERRRRHHGHV